MSVTDTEFVSIESIETWAKGHYFGGYESYSYIRFGVEAEIIIGSPTSGLPSSEITVYLKKGTKPFRRHLFQSKIYGIVKVEESAESILFILPSGKKLLSLPWEGLIEAASS